MLKKLVKLPFKIALLPLKVVKKVVMTALNLGGDEDRPAAGVTASQPPPSRATPPPAAEPSGPSPAKVQVDPGDVLSRAEGGEGFVFVDVREAGELAATGKLEGALHIPLRDLPRRFEELSREAPIVLYCAVGMRSLDAAMFLRDKGFENAWSLRGGLPNWQAGGGEVVPA